VRLAGFLAALLLALSMASAQINSVVNSKHNLSVSGTGSVRSTSEQEVCIFCHTPHNSAPIEPLWNRNVPVNTYRVYSSNSLKALPGQPTGSSKLCLSCHDGTIALGSVLNRQMPIRMRGGTTLMPPGTSNLGTDLRDDHPVSFRYDSQLAGKNTTLRDPNNLPSQIKLDANRELQCTACHDAHDNTWGSFLVMDNRNSQLCTSCHNQGQTTITAHQQCASCHQQHGAPSGPYLLKGSKVVDTCAACHSGQSGGQQGPNIAADLKKISSHETSPDVNIAFSAGNSSCSDCHEPHTMTTATAAAPAIQGSMGKISGINGAGAAVTSAQYEYEVCYKCHADNRSVQPRIPRQIVQGNVRLEFDPSAISFHPIEAPGKSANVPSLVPGLSVNSIIYCSDCHASDSTIKGVHGSNNPGLLKKTYLTADNTSESAAAYALCYSCHRREVILSNTSWKQHKKHIADKKTPCSACHDPHGIAAGQGTVQRNSRLINFDTTIVQADSQGRRYYDHTSKTCYLRCHNKTHDQNTN